jgi:hypothetical protein
MNFVSAETPEPTPAGVCLPGESALAVMPSIFANCTSSKTADFRFGQLGELAPGKSQLLTPLDKEDGNRRISYRRRALMLG